MNNQARIHNPIDASFFLKEASKRDTPERSQEGEIVKIWVIGSGDRRERIGDGNMRDPERVSWGRNGLREQ